MTAMLRICLMALAFPTAALLHAQSDGAQAAGRPATVADTLRPVTHEWLYGAGRINVLDTYLSPLEYTGPALSVTHRSERLARWGKGKVSVQGFFTGRAAYLQSPTEDHKEWDAHLTAAVAWHRNWHPRPGLRLAAGGMGQLGGGFTYNTNGGNNPAQGRLAADIAFSGIAEYAFRIGRQPFLIGTQVDAPLVGAAFTPNFGQSYYEIFSLGHYNRNVRLTHPFNAPSLRWLTTCRFRLLGATLSVGYLADIRQSHLNSLKHHAWNHQFVVGYVRRLNILR